MQKTQPVLFCFIALLFSLACSSASANLNIYESEANVTGTHNSVYSPATTLKNTDLTANITNISCSVSGNVASWITFSNCPAILQNNTNYTLNFNVAVPRYTAPDIYTASINVNGLLNGNNVNDNVPVNALITGNASILLAWAKEPVDIYRDESRIVEFNVTNNGNVLLPVNINVTSVPLVSFNATAILGVAESRKINLSINAASSAKIGAHDIKVIASGANITEARAELERSFNIIYPYCSALESGHISFEKITNEADLSNEEFNPLNSFNIELKIKNTDEENRYAVAEAVLVYGDEAIDDTEIKEKVKIEDKDSGELKLVMNIPIDAKEGTYYLYIRVYDDENENNCEQKSVKIKVEKDSYAIIPYEIVIEPAKIECGKEFSVKGRMANIGSSDENKVKISYEDDFGNADYKVFNDIDEGEKSSLFSFIFAVPADANNGSHTINLKAFYDYDGVSGDYDEEKSFSYHMAVGGNCYKETKSFSISVQPTAYAGKKFDISFVVRNTGNINTSYKFEASCEWANINSIEPVDATLRVNESKTVKITLTPKEGISLGTHVVDAKVTYAGKTESIPIAVNLAESKSAITGGFLSGEWLKGVEGKLTSNWTWIVVDMVLFMAILSFIAYFLVKPRGSFKKYVQPKAQTSTAIQPVISK